MTELSRTEGVWGFALVFCGTLGLLANELAFHWGRSATLVFAGLNVVGLAIIAQHLWGKIRA
jgi:hypothetical protein